MPNNPALVRALARERATELRQAANSGASSRHEVPRAPVILTARRATGWLLVDVGLRLALPRRSMTRAAARAHR